jgi:uncharacterized damage-inducible protein DinB
MTASQARMNTSQIVTVDFDDEMVQTRKLLERVPLDEAHRDYKPHAKSMALGPLAYHVAELPSWLKFALEAEEFNVAADFKHPIASSTSELLEIFDKSAAEGRAAVAAATDEDMMKTWTFKYKGEPVFSNVRTKVIRSFINHLVHHRAQLGVYLRMNDIPVPGMYGPSADDGWEG